MSGREGVIYLDNAATSFPKAPGVAEAVADHLLRAAGNPGRSGHGLALAAQVPVDEARRRLSALLGAADASRLAFAQNATDALNTALWGLCRAGDRVLTSGLEHNAVVRPLAELALRRAVTVERVACGGQGTLDLAALETALRAGPVRLLALVHASNVSGAILPVAEAAALARAHGALVLLDASQTAGVLPLDVRSLGADLVALPGHKGLLGPTGTGALWVAPGLALPSFRQGGTGSHSEEERHPERMPEALEAGTLNAAGLAGLAAALRWLEERGVERVRAHEEALTGRLLGRLGEVRGVEVVGPAEARARVGVVSIRVDGWEPVDLAAALDASFGIAVRAGLHCAPLAHRSLGTLPAGTLRLSPGAFSTEDEIDGAAAAIAELASG